MRIFAMPRLLRGVPSLTARRRRQDIQRLRSEERIAGVMRRLSQRATKTRPKA